MEETNIIQQENTDKQPETVSVPREKLAEFTKALIAAKEQNAELMNMLGSSVEIFDFIKENLFGGKLPTEFTAGTFLKMGTRLMRMKDKLDDENMKILGAHMEVIKSTAGKYLSEDQVNKIAK